MVRSTLFDRLNHELEAFGKKAQAALDEGKLHIELMRIRRKRDNAARDLGLLIHKRERGGEIEVRRTDALLLRLDDLEAELSRLDRQLEEARRQRPSKSAAGGAPPSESAAGEPPRPAAGTPV
ncbi:MAG TPA: hypothetical protein VJQ46_17915 [Gemmatimonadales bacterium]|nr:hypothetical protein [Gemmatimonadales bacterium]